MKNTECVIYIITKHGYTQIYRKDNNFWTQTSPNGIVRRMTAEQLLSHLLPPLMAGNKSNLIVRVERRNRTEEYTKRNDKKDSKRFKKRTEYNK
jgi:predicted alpha/beta superfamily hydrolase